MNNESKCLFRGHCGMASYTTQWRQVQCLAFRRRFKGLNNSWRKTNILQETNKPRNWTEKVLRETNNSSNGMKYLISETNNPSRTKNLLRETIIPAVGQETSFGTQTVRERGKKMSFWRQIILAIGQQSFFGRQIIPVMRQKKPPSGDK